VVFGSARRGVSRYDRRSGQTAQVGPDSAARGDKFGRNVRTMPLIWVAAEPERAVLHVQRRVEVGRPCTYLDALSPDLARQTWPIPASVGKYAAAVTPTPRGAITACRPPQKQRRSLAGTDDGNVQVTTNAARPGGT